MALVQIKMVSGFYPDKHSLKELQKTGPESFRRAEFEKNMVNLYFDKVSVIIIFVLKRNQLFASHPF